MGILVNYSAKELFAFLKAVRISSVQELGILQTL